MINKRIPNKEIVKEYFSNVQSQDELNHKMLIINKKMLVGLLIHYIFNPNYLVQNEITFNKDYEAKYNNFPLIFSVLERYYLNYEYIFNNLVGNSLLLKRKTINQFPYEFITLLGLSFYKHFDIDMFTCGIQKSYLKRTKSLGIRNLDFYSEHRLYKHMESSDDTYSANLLHLDSFVIYFLKEYGIELEYIAKHVEFKEHKELSEEQKEHKKSIYITSFEEIRTKLDIE